MSTVQCDSGYTAVTCQSADTEHYIFGGGIDEQYLDDDGVCHVRSGGTDGAMAKIKCCKVAEKES